MALCRNKVLLMLVLLVLCAGCGSTNQSSASSQKAAFGQSVPQVSQTGAQQAAQDLFEQSIKADIRKDYKTELQLCKQLADKKDVRGDMCLVVLYGDGKPGIPKDLKESAKWQLMLAEQGDAFTQSSLANQAIFGSELSGLTKYRNQHPLFPAEAVYWNRKVAEQGYAGAQFELAILLFDHQGGVAQDDIESYKWATLAMENKLWPTSTPGFVGAIRNMRGQLAQRMTKDKISEALKRAHDWQPNVSEATRIMQQADRTQKRLRFGKYVGPYLGSPVGSGPK